MISTRRMKRRRRSCLDLHN